MKSRWWLPLLVVMGCDDPPELPAEVDAGGHQLDSGHHQTEEDSGTVDDSGVIVDSGSALDAAVDAGWDAGEDETFGLSKRVPNTTCLAPKFGEPMPQRLSETGCFDESNPKLPLPMLIPFDLNAALWSDGASKRRWFALPDGETIALGEAGDFMFPVGTQMIKEFSIGNRLLETRFFVFHHAADPVDAGTEDDAGAGPVNLGPQWVGYAYRWNDDQSDAVLIEDGPDNEVDLDGPGPETETWHIPTRTECMTCHTQVAGFTLGPEIGQLNRDFTYPSTGRTSNELLTLEHIGVLAEPLAPIGTLLRFEPYQDNPDPEVSVEEKARSYLHVNCSMCHRKPGMGGTGGAAPDDFRATINFDEMNLCNESPKSGAAAGLGMDPGTARILAPASPMDSVLWRRMSFRPDPANPPLSNWQMPPIATRKVDELGKGLLETWINTITSCPE